MFLNGFIAQFFGENNGLLRQDAVGHFLAVNVTDSGLGVAVPAALISRSAVRDHAPWCLITAGIVGPALAVRMPLLPSQGFLRAPATAMVDGLISHPTTSDPWGC